MKKLNKLKVKIFADGADLNSMIKLNALNYVKASLQILH